MQASVDHGLVRLPGGDARRHVPAKAPPEVGAGARPRRRRPPRRQSRRLRPAPGRAGVLLGFPELATRKVAMRRDFAARAFAIASLLVAAPALAESGVNRTSRPVRLLRTWDETVKAPAAGSTCGASRSCSTTGRASRRSELLRRRPPGLRHARHQAEAAEPVARGDRGGVVDRPPGPGARPHRRAQERGARRAGSSSRRARASRCGPGTRCLQIQLLSPDREGLVRWTVVDLVKREIAYPVYVPREPGRDGRPAVRLAALRAPGARAASRHGGADLRRQRAPDVLADRGSGLGVLLAAAGPVERQRGLGHRASQRLLQRPPGHEARAHPDPERRVPARGLRLLPRLDGPGSQVPGRQRDLARATPSRPFLR